MRVSFRMPAEHGAWGILATPFFCAAAVAGGWDAPVWLVLVCAFSLFLLRGSVETNLAQPGAQSWWEVWLLPTHVALAAACTIAALVLVVSYQRYLLIPLGVLAALLYVAQRWLIERHNKNHAAKRSLAAALVGVALLVLTAPAVWIAARGELNVTGVQLWLLNLLFFLGGVLYVKYRVRGLFLHQTFRTLRERLAFAWPVVLYHLLLLAFLACWVWLDSLSAAVLVAFTPGVLRASALLFQLGKRFPIRRLGWSEVVHAVIFGLLVVLALRANA